MKEYDYSQNGYYFVTFRTFHNNGYLGRIQGSTFDRKSDKVMVLNENGLIVEFFIKSLEKQYENVLVEQYCIMPNHVHLLLAITDDSSIYPVGAVHEPPAAEANPPAAEAILPAAKANPPVTETNPPIANAKPPTAEVYPLTAEANPPAINTKPPAGKTEMLAAKPHRSLLSKAIGYLKMNSAKQIRLKHPHIQAVWQRDYHDRVVRNEAELKRIKEYMRENPKRWLIDVFFTDEVQ